MKSGKKFDIMARLVENEVSWMTVVLVIGVTSALVHGVNADSCYWCGPLAEQVHRSRRPPPCRTPLDPAHTIACDASHPYCAIVATTPPYTESRICTRHYKETCYPRFCTTTNTWRMTCSCQGNLCNGEKDQRTVEAFAKLAKHNITITTTTTAAVTSTPPHVVKISTYGDEHEFHNAQEINTLWPLSSESDTAESLPSAAALREGGGDDDEDSSEGSGAALRSDSPKPMDTERTTLLNRKTTTPPTETEQSDATVPIVSILTSIMAAILVLN